MHLLIAYATTDGMTARIAARMAETCRSAGVEATVVDLSDPPQPLELESFDGILVGASMHAKGYQRAVRRFIRHHLLSLESRPTAFFSVCLALLSKDPEERAAAHQMAEDFPHRLGWRPDLIEPIAGALLWSRYGRLRRHALLRIARREMGDEVDPTRDTVFTDWKAVTRFVEEFIALVARRQRPPRSFQPAAPWA